VAVVSARLLASLHVKQAAALQIKSAKIKTKNNLKCRQKAAFFIT
jgi:hypothetical protein